MELCHVPNFPAPDGDIPDDLKPLLLLQPLPLPPVQTPVLVGLLLDFLATVTLVDDYGDMLYYRILLGDLLS